MEITIFTEKDLNKNGLFKKNNNAIELKSKEEFFNYLKINNLNIESEYIDLIGKISNNLKFRCSHLGFVVGVSSIVKEFKEFESQDTEELNKHFGVTD